MTLQVKHSMLQVPVFVSVAVFRLTLEVGVAFMSLCVQNILCHYACGHTVRYPG